MARLLSLFFSLLILFSFASCSGDDDPVTPLEPDPDSGITPLAKKGDRTVLIYIAAQNSLGTSRYHLTDSVEIMKGRQYLDDNDRLLLFIDDASAPPRIYYVTKDKDQPERVRTWATDSCSTSPRFFEGVLEWMRNYFPAEEYGLVLWSHASGWLPSTNTDYSTSRLQPKAFGIDDGNSSKSDRGAQMDVDSIAWAIQTAGIHPKYIFFDACLMQCVEVDYALKDVTDYVIASPIQTSALGSNYTTQLQNGLFADDPTQIVPTYYDAVANSPQEYGDFGIVLSAVRTDKLDALSTAFNRTLYTSTLAGKYSPNMDDVLNYQSYCYTYGWRPHAYDARQAIEHIFTDATARADVLAALDNCIVRKAATSSFYIGPGIFNMQTVDLSDYAGISLFIPQDVYTTNSSSRYGDHNLTFRSTRWYTAAGWSQTGW